MLALVLADGYRVGLVEQDVRGLQDGVVEQPHVAAALVLELGHPRRLAEPCEAGQDPSQLGVLGQVALREQAAPRGVDTHSEQLGHQLPGLRPQLGGLG